MKPMERYDLEPGEWRPDLPHIGYGADREGLVQAIRSEPRPRAWSVGTSHSGTTITVGGRAVSCPPTPEVLAHLESLATPAPMGEAKIRSSMRRCAEVHPSLVREEPVEPRVRVEPRFPDCAVPTASLGARAHARPGG